MHSGYIFNGEAHNHHKVLELIEDIGGYILSKKLLAYEATISMVIPDDEIDTVKMLATELRAEFRPAPLIGTEIAVIAPTIARHHLPHILCDLGEYVRKYGAKNNMLGLARGVGQRISQMNLDEIKVIEEHDLALFVVGNFEYCILNYKSKLFDLIKNIPILVLGGPKLEKDKLKFPYLDGYGRINYRLGTNPAEMKKLDLLIETLNKLIMERKEKINNDPFLISPFILKKEVENQIPDIAEQFSPMPLVVKLDGVRIKLPYDLFADKIRAIKIGNTLLGEIAYINKSVIKDQILVKLRPQSELA